MHSHTSGIIYNRQPQYYTAPKSYKCWAINRRRQTIPNITLLYSLSLSKKIRCAALY